MQCGKRIQKILILECDDRAFKRATYINQARVHMGYHYPRSFSTAIRSAKYFERFNCDYNFCIHKKFEQVYATSTDFSWTNAAQFHKFCKSANIRCDEIPVERYFKSGMCDGAFLTEEYTYDAQILKEHLLKELNQLSNVDILYNSRIDHIIKNENHYTIYMKNKTEYSSDFILNTTYASVNQILNHLGFEPNMNYARLLFVMLVKV